MTGKNKLVLCDTNIIVRYLLGEKTELGQKALIIMEQIQSGSFKTLIQESVLAECVFILSKVYLAPKDRIAHSLKGMLLYKGIINQDKEALQNSLDIYASSNLHIVDCLLLAKSHYIGAQLLTFDRELEKYYVKHYKN